VSSALNFLPPQTKARFAPRVYLAGLFLLTAFRQRPSPRSRRRCLTAARPIVIQMARAEGDHFAENAYAFPRRRDCGDDILGASGHADSAPPRCVANGRSSRQRMRPLPIPGTRRGVPFVRAWSLSGWILWVARGNGCPPGYWRGPWGTAATRRFTDGIRTDRGIRPRLTISSSEGRLSGPPFLFASCDGDHGFGSKITAVEPRSCGAFFAPLRRAWLSRPAIAGNPSPAKPSSIIAHVEGSGTVAVKMISASVSMPSICKLPELVGN
jgi:hypothetical protein